MYRKQITLKGDLFQEILFVIFFTTGKERGKIKSNQIMSTKQHIKSNNIWITLFPVD